MSFNEFYPGNIVQLRNNIGTAYYDNHRDDTTLVWKIIHRRTHIVLYGPGDVDYYKFGTVSMYMGDLGCEYKWFISNKLKDYCLILIGRQLKIAEKHSLICL